MPEAEAVSIASKVCEALEHVHEARRRALRPQARQRDVVSGWNHPAHRLRLGPHRGHHPLYPVGRGAADWFLGLRRARANQTQARAQECGHLRRRHPAVRDADRQDALSRRRSLRGGQRALARRSARTAHLESSHLAPSGRDRAQGAAPRSRRTLRQRRGHEGRSRSSEQVAVTGLSDRLQPVTRWRRTFAFARHIATWVLLPVASQVILFLLLWRHLTHKP
jgi:hypothetical protein